MDAQEWNQIDRIVVSCTEALFLSLGVTVEHVGVADESAAAPRQTLAVMGFGGLQMRGSLLMSADASALTLLHPARAGGAAPAEDELCDWSGELANQLLGRVKNRLLAHGLVIQQSTPTTLSGLDLRLGASTRNALCLPHLFRASGHTFQVRFEAVAEPDVHFGEAAPGDEEIGGEGDTLLF